MILPVCGCCLHVDYVARTALVLWGNAVLKFLDVVL